MTRKIHDLTNQNRIINAMAINQFLNPISETVINKNNDLINSITKTHSKK